MAPEAIPQAPLTAPAAVPEGLILPAQIISQADISRLTREMEDMEEFFTQAALKAADAKTIPQASQQLDAIVQENSLNLLQKEDRQTLGQFLKTVMSKAPVVHASFATDPRPDFLMKLTAWFRTEAHPHVLLHIGLQPNIAAGCIIRTNNKYFDFSFQQHFKDSKEKLIAAMRVES